MISGLKNDFKIKKTLSVRKAFLDSFWLKDLFVDGSQNTFHKAV